MSLHGDELERVRMGFMRQELAVFCAARVQSKVGAAGTLVHPRGGAVFRLWISLANSADDALFIILWNVFATDACGILPEHYNVD